MTGSTDNSTGSVDTAEAQALEYVQQAQEATGTLPDIPADTAVRDVSPQHAQTRVPPPPTSRVLHANTRAAELPTTLLRVLCVR